MPLAFEDAIFVLDQGGAIALVLVDLQDDTYVACTSGWQIEHGTGSAEFGHLQLHGPAGVAAINACVDLQVNGGDVDILPTGIGQIWQSGAYQLRGDLAGPFGGGRVVLVGIDSILLQADDFLGAGNFSTMQVFRNGAFQMFGTVQPVLSGRAADHNYGGLIPVALKGDATYTGAGPPRTPLMVAATFAGVTDGLGRLFINIGFTLPSTAYVVSVTGGAASAAVLRMPLSSRTTTQFIIVGPASTAIDGSWLLAWNV